MGCTRTMGFSHLAKVVWLRVEDRRTARPPSLIWLVRIGGSMVHAWMQDPEDESNVVALVCSDGCKRAMEDAVQTGGVRRVQ